MEILEVTVENFDEKVLNSEKPVMLDFWATWCGPCQMQAPIFHAFAEKHADTAVFGKVNVDEQPQLALNYQIVSIPTLVFMKDGMFQKKMVGLQTQGRNQAGLCGHQTGGTGKERGTGCFCGCISGTGAAG